MPSVGPPSPWPSRPLRFLGPGKRSHFHREVAAQHPGARGVVCLRPREPLGSSPPSVLAGSWSDLGPCHDLGRPLLHALSGAPKLFYNRRRVTQWFLKPFPSLEFGFLKSRRYSHFLKEELCLALAGVEGERLMA